MAKTKQTQIEVSFDFERATKNTFRFKEKKDPLDAVVGTIYVKQTEFPDGKPDGVKITIEPIYNESK